MTSPVVLATVVGEYVTGSVLLRSVVPVGDGSVIPVELESVITSVMLGVTDIGISVAFGLGVVAAWDSGKTAGNINTTAIKT